MKVIKELGTLANGERVLLVQCGKRTQYVLTRNYDPNAPEDEQWGSGTYYQDLSELTNAMAQAQNGISIERGKELIRKLVDLIKDRYGVEASMLLKEEACITEKEVHALGLRYPSADELHDSGDFTLENGYFSHTTFWMDFSIADRFGVSGIRETYQIAIKNWKKNYVYLTELIIVLNLKCFHHHEKGNQAYAELYADLFEDAQKIADETITDPYETRYLFHWTD